MGLMSVYFVDAWQLYQGCIFFVHLEIRGLVPKPA